MFHTTRRVEFADTDAAGILHFASFFRLMEQAEHELWRSIGLSVYQQLDGETVTWPRVAAACEYRSAVRFEDVLDIDVTISRLGSKSVTFVFAFSCAGRTVAEGTITAVCCTLQPHSPPVSIVIPTAIREKLLPLIVATDSSSSSP